MCDSDPRVDTLVQSALTPVEWLVLPLPERRRLAERRVREWEAAARRGDATAQGQLRLLPQRRVVQSKPAIRPRLPAGKPKVALVSHTLEMGGAERCMVDLAASLDRKRLEVLGLGSWNTARDDSLTRRAAQHTTVLFGSEACEELAAECDVLVFWGLQWCPRVVPPAIVYVSHGSGEWARARLPNMDGSVWHAAAVSQAAASVFPDPGRAKVLHNGVDESRLQPAFGRVNTRRKLGITPDEVVVGFLGRISPEKHPAAAAIAAQEIGGRALYAGPDRGGAQYLFREINPGAVFLPPTEQVGDVYAAIDCFLLASSSEGFSLSLTEAWLAGVPVVATRVGAVPELESEFGTLVQPVPVAPKAADLAGAVRAAVSSEFQPTVERARQMAQQHFTLESYGRRWSDWLLEVARATGG